MDKLMRYFSIASLVTPLAILSLFIARVLIDGLPYLDIGFVLGTPSYDPDKIGILPVIVGSIYIVGLSSTLSFLMGLGLSIYVVEFLSNERFKSFIYFIVDMLAGVPSVVYGLVGLGFIGYVLGAGRSVLTGVITMSFLILPLTVVASLEAFRSIPDSLKYSAYSLGASRQQVVTNILIPLGISRALTGSILAVARALGEAAPILVISGLLFTKRIPLSLFDEFTVLPLYIFNLVTRPQTIYKDIASAVIIVLITLFMLVSLTSIYFRLKYSYRLYEV